MNWRLVIILWIFLGVSVGVVGKLGVDVKCVTEICFLGYTL